MPINVVEFEEKRYTIDGAEFKLKQPTLGIKRRGAGLASILLIKLGELTAISDKYTGDGNIDESNPNAYQELCKTAERINELTEEIFIKAEELFKIILEPVEAGGKSKLIADNLSEEIVGRAVSDFFQIAGISITPANN